MRYKLQPEVNRLWLTLVYTFRVCLLFNAILFIFWRNAETPPYPWHITTNYIIPLCLLIALGTVTNSKK